MRPPHAESGIGRAVGDRELMIDLGQFHVLHGGLQVRPRLRARCSGIPPAASIRRVKSNGPVTSNCSIGVRSFSSIRSWIFAVRRFTSAVSKSDSNWTRCNSSRSRSTCARSPALKTRPIHVQLPIPISQILLGILQNRFGLQRLHEGAAQVEHQAALLVRVGGSGDDRSIPWRCPPQLALVFPLMQVADDWAKAECPRSGR